MRISPAIADLMDRIHAVETRGSFESGVAATGWGAVDAVLPGGGLRRGATHEWIGEGDRGWSAPLFLVAHLARTSAGADGWIVWIGRRAWPYASALARAGQGALLRRCLWVDPPDTGSRLWAVDAALRCSGMTIVADGSGLEDAGSRRLQLAAEAGGSFGLLARPPKDIKAISFAWSRWIARCEPARETVGGCDGGSIGRVVRARWRVTLDRCKGLPRCDSHQWTLERDERGRVVALSADVADRRAPVSAAS